MGVARGKRSTEVVGYLTCILFSDTW